MPVEYIKSKHSGLYTGNVSESNEKSIMDVLDEIETLISNAMAIKRRTRGR